jgi:hypothetical protein
MRKSSKKLPGLVLGINKPSASPPGTVFAFHTRTAVRRKPRSFRSSEA